MIRLDIEEKDFPAFLACLGIGTLYSIRSGVLPTEVGIWSLAAPIVHAPQAVTNCLPTKILEVYQTCDELSAIQELLPDILHETVTKLMDELKGEVSRIQKPVWRFWVDMDDTGDANNSRA